MSVPSTTSPPSESPLPPTPQLPTPQPSTTQPPTTQPPTASPSITPSPPPPPIPQAPATSPSSTLSLPPPTIPQPPTTAPSTPTPSLSPNEQTKVSPRRPRPSTKLPAIRLLLSPTLGVGVDVRLPYSKPVRLFLALEGYVNGTSHVRLGFELNRFPFVRLEAVPNPNLSIRPSTIRLGDLKFVTTGINIPLMGSSRGRIVQPVFELQHRYTILGSLFDKKQRESLHKLYKANRYKLLTTVQNQSSQDELKQKIRQQLDEIMNKDANNQPQNWPNVLYDLSENALGFSKKHGEEQNLDQRAQIDRPPLEDVKKAAMANRAERRYPSPVLGRMQVGKDGKLHLVPNSNPNDLARVEAMERENEVNDAVNSLLDENPLMVFGRKMWMSLPERLRRAGDDSGKKN